MTTYYIGWDVGAWKCKNGREDSCDAIVVLNGNEIVGFNRRRLSSTLQDTYSEPTGSRQEYFINLWFKSCGIQTSYSQKDHYVLAIDTPLGWPNDCKNLLHGVLSNDWAYDDEDLNLQNTLLYRYTEREKLGSAMSVIVDSIGSQSVKGIALLEILEAEESSWGVWKSDNITLIETYPKACLVRPDFVNWMRDLELTANLTKTFKTKISENPTQYRNVEVIAEDLFDATVCSCVAKAYFEEKPALVRPSDQDPEEFKPEGWVFFPDSPEDDRGPSIANNHWKTTCREGIASFHEAIGECQEYVQG